MKQLNLSSKQIKSNEMKSIHTTAIKVAPKWESMSQ